MSDPLTPDQATDVSGKQKNFIGKVVGSSVDGIAQEALDHGYNQSENKYETDGTRFDHFAFIKPIDGTYDKYQNILSMTVRDGRQTKWMTLMSHFYAIHGDEWAEEVDSYKDIPGFIKGRVYEWQDVSWTEDEEIPGLGITYQAIGRNNDQINNMLVPIREVTDENELADLEGSVDNTVDDTVSI